MANDRDSSAPDGEIEVLDDEHLEEADLDASAAADEFEDEATAIYRPDSHALPEVDFEDEATRVVDPDESDEFEDEATRVWQHEAAPRPSSGSPRNTASGFPPSVQLPQRGVSSVGGHGAPMPDDATVITDSAAVYAGAAPRQQVARPRQAGGAVDERRSKGSPGVVILIGLLVAAIVAIVFFFVRGPVSTAPATGTMALFTSPSGASVTLDGVALPNTTPTTLGDLEVGRAHTLVLELEGFQPIEESLVVSGDGLQQRQFQFEPATGTVIVRTVPIGAAITVDGISRGISPLSVPDLDTSRSHDIVATLEGHEPARRTVSFDAGGPGEHLVALTLAAIPPPAEGSADEPAEPETTVAVSTRRSSSSSSSTSSRSSSSSSSSGSETSRTSERSRPSSRTASTSTHRERPSRTRPSEAAEAGVGTVSVQAVPFGQVWIDGRMVASETPLIGHEVSSGVHRVKVYYVSLRQFSDERSVRIDADGSRTLTFRATQ